MVLNNKSYNKSLTSFTFEKIRDGILNNHYTIGEKLIEANIASDLGVSRTPVREALKQLEIEGLIESFPNRGMVVKGISKQDVEDIFVVRTILEKIAVQLAIENMSVEIIPQLKEIYELMEFYSYKNKCENFLELSTQFHEVIYSATKSRYLDQLLTDYHFYVKLSRNYSIHIEGRMEEALSEYRAILNGFESGNIIEACNAMAYHIQNVKHTHIN